MQQRMPRSAADARTRRSRAPARRGSERVSTHARPAGHRTRRHAGRSSGRRSSNCKKSSPPRSASSTSPRVVGRRCRPSPTKCRRCTGDRGGSSGDARLFQQAGLAMFRCRRDGALTQVNRAAMTLVSRRTIDELRGGQFATAVFEDPKGLSLLIERCVTSRTRESIEPTGAARWRPALRALVGLRLLARRDRDSRRGPHASSRPGGAAWPVAANGSGWTARSEVAITCGNLLNDIHQTIQEWLISSGGSTASRQQGELLLAEVTRAAGLLQQLRPAVTNRAARRRWSI